jgi:hypothetical protein
MEVSRCPASRRIQQSSAALAVSYQPSAFRFRVVLQLHELKADR